MAVKFVNGSDPNNPLLDRESLRPGFDMYRGKVLPKARASWGAVDGDKKSFDRNIAQKVLNEAER
jgi:hypothetical protein